MRLTSDPTLGHLMPPSFFSCSTGQPTPLTTSPPSFRSHLVLMALLLRVPVLTIHRIGWSTNSATNKSEPYLIQANRDKMTKVADILNRGLVVYLTYITMIICVCVLSFKLHQAAQIRRLCTAGKSQPSDAAQEEAGNQIMSSKDLQVVKSVVVVPSLSWHCYRLC